MDSTLENSRVVFAKSLLVSVSVLLLVVSCFMSCSEPEEPAKIVGAPLTITDVDEQFDAESTLQVRARFTTLRPDTIAAVGFVYTDALEEQVTPTIGVDHIVSVDSVHEDKFWGPGSTYFEGFINPTRISPLNYSYRTSIVAYITAVSGKTYMSEVVTLAGDKLKFNNVYPRYAVTGSVVKVTLNRQFFDKKFYASHLGGFYGEPHDVSLFVNDQTISIDSISTYGELFFKMPEGLSEDALLHVRVDEYDIEYEKPLKNTTLSFELATKIKRPYNSGYFMFSSPGAIYLGGGDDDAHTKALPDFWKYDVATKIWSRIADYPSTGRERGMAFTVGDSAYCGNPDNFQRYNFSTNTWSMVPVPTNDLQYNHTFSSGNSVAYNGKAYFTNFSKPLNLGGIYLGNFWQFDPVTQKYKMLSDVLGVTGSYDYSGYMAHAVVYNNQFHFFRNLQHWSYNPQTSNWSSFKDIDFGGRDIRAFLFKGEIYGIVTTTFPDAYFGSMGKTYTLCKYNFATDSWTKDSDVPLTYNGSEDILSMAVSFNIIQVSDTEVYLCLVNGWEFTFHKIKG